MHELGIVVHIIKSLEKVASEEGVDRITSVTLELGEVSGIVETYLTDCWKWAAARSERSDARESTGTPERTDVQELDADGEINYALIRGSNLHIENIPAVTYCEDCGGEYPTVAHGKLCPHCGSERTYLLRGDELIIKEIAVW